MDEESRVVMLEDRKKLESQVMSYTERLVRVRVRVRIRVYPSTHASARRLTR
jgi:hypothetical protein